MPRSRFARWLPTILLAASALSSGTAHGYSYDYNKLQRLTSADYGTPGSETFNLDSLGNRMTYVDTRGGGQTIRYAGNLTEERRE